MFYKIDFKSFLIGVLSLSCILMFMGYGAKNDAHFDTVYANEIVLHTSDYSQFLYPSGSILYDKGTNMSILTSAFVLIILPALSFLTASKKNLSAGPPPDLVVC